MRPTLWVLLCLSLVVSTASAQASPDDPLAPSARAEGRAPAEMLASALRDAQPAFLQCGTRSRAPIDALREVVVIVDVGGRRPSVTVEQPPAGARGRALVRCVQRVGLRAARRIPRAAGAASVTPYAALQPPPGPMPADLQAGCTADSECALVCPALPDCCGGQCGCHNAILSQHADIARAGCTRAQRCPAVGCAMEEYHAVCRAGRCTAQRGNFGF